MDHSRIRTFAPVPTKARHDGWTPARQRRLIEELAATKSIVRACRAVGMSRASAYKLRDRADAADFRRAWDRALRPPEERPRVRRLRRLNGRLAASVRKVDEAHEVHGPPDSPGRTLHPSSRLQTLEALLETLDPGRAARKRAAQGGPLGSNCPSGA